MNNLCKRDDKRKISIRLFNNVKKGKLSRKQVIRNCVTDTISGVS